MVMGALCVYVQRIQMLDKKNKAKIKTLNLESSGFFFIFVLSKGSGAVGSVLGLGPRGRRFEPCLPYVNVSLAQW